MKVNHYVLKETKKKPNKQNKQKKPLHHLATGHRSMSCQGKLEVHHLSPQDTDLISPDTDT